ncbi:unnamed protein product, partial [Strongylus vulgaris]
ESALARGKSVYPKVTVFSEILPLASKNHSNAKRGRPAASSCTQELQALFSCLKKWEFDDKPCGKQHTAYMDCVHESERAMQEYKEAATKEVFYLSNRNNAALASFITNSPALTFIALVLYNVCFTNNMEWKSFTFAIFPLVKRIYFSFLKGILGEGAQGKSLTTAQFNKLMKLFPQPDLGQRPYRQMKRLPTQSYAEDIFHRKHWKMKPS